MLEALSNEWVAFQQCLIDSDAMLKKSKEKFKTGLLHSAEDLKKSVAALQDDLNLKGAFNAKIPVNEVILLVSVKRCLEKHDRKYYHHHNQSSPSSMLSSALLLSLLLSPLSSSHSSSSSYSLRLPNRCRPRTRRLYRSSYSFDNVPRIIFILVFFLRHCKM